MAGTRPSSAESRPTSASTRRCSTSSNRGVEVQVAEDAVASRFGENKRVGLQKMERAGAVLTSVETALFELLGRAGTDEFKRIQAKLLPRGVRPERATKRGGGRVSGYVLLEDGTRLDGELVGSGGEITGEVVFNTSMTGYQEAVTDPSYAGQIITFTYPADRQLRRLADAMESDRVQARGVIMREGKNGEDVATAEGGWLDWLRDCGVAAIIGVDTRALVRHIRDRGAMRAGIFPAEPQRGRGARAVGAEPSMEGADFAREVTPAEPIEIEGDGPHVVGIDTGIKLSIVRQLKERSCRITLLPCDSSAEEVLARDPDLVFLANGPGDPGALDYVVDSVAGWSARSRWWICLGPSAALPGGRPRDLQAPLRPPRRQSPGQGPGDGPDRDHLAEPRLRGQRPGWRREDRGG